MRRLVFLHGFLGSPSEANLWQDHLPDYEVSAPTIGLGDDWDEEINRLATVLPADSHLAGYSLGGRLAIALALRFPQRWRSLIVISGNPGLATAVERADRKAADNQWCDLLQRKSIADFLDCWYQQEVFAGDPAETITKLVSERLSTDRRAAARILQVLSIANQPDYRSDLSNLSIPVLLLAGASDQKYVNLGREMSERLPMAEFRVVVGAGHALHRSHSNETFRTIQEFLQRVDAQSRNSSELR